MMNMIMILPLITALPVSHNRDGKISGELFISRKDDHSLLIIELKSGSSKCNVLNRHLIGGLICAFLIWVLIAGLITVLKSPAIMIFVEVLSKENKL